MGIGIGLLLVCKTSPFPWVDLDPTNTEFLFSVATRRSETNLISSYFRHLRSRNTPTFYRQRCTTHAIRCTMVTAVSWKLKPNLATLYGLFLQPWGPQVAMFATKGYKKSSGSSSVQCQPAVSARTLAYGRTRVVNSAECWPTMQTPLLGSRNCTRKHCRATNY